MVQRKRSDSEERRHTSETHPDEGEPFNPTAREVNSARPGEARRVYRSLTEVTRE